MRDSVVNGERGLGETIRGRGRSKECVIRCLGTVMGRRSLMMLPLVTLQDNVVEIKDLIR